MPRPRGRPSVLKRPLVTETLRKLRQVGHDEPLVGPEAITGWISALLGQAVTWRTVRRWCDETGEPWLYFHSPLSRVPGGMGGPRSSKFMVLAWFVSLQGSKLLPSWWSPVGRARARRVTP
jgi:hypothetical protein